MRFEGKLAILIFILAGGWIVFLAIFPNMSDVIVASGTMTMAFGTFLMAYITYVSYRNLSIFQKKSLEPALSVSLWRVSMYGQGPIDGYGVAIKNDGHGIAKNVKLSLNWAFEPMDTSDYPSAWEFMEEELSKTETIDIGNIASKDEENSSLSKFIEPKDILEMNNIYGVKLEVICEDVFGQRLEEYRDIKKILLRDAEPRKIE
jgi:hypothetical protein